MAAVNPKRNEPPPLPVRAARVLAKLKAARALDDLDDGEKSVHALGIAASPQERWDLFESRVRSFGYWKPLRRKKSATRSLG